MIVIGSDVVESYLPTTPAIEGSRLNDHNSTPGWTSSPAPSGAIPRTSKPHIRRQAFLKAGRVVFNIKDNDYRLIARVQYQASVVMIRFFGTHAEYDEMTFDRKTYRIRINGRAGIRRDAESLGRHCGAKAVIRVECLAYTRIVRAMYQTSRQAKARSTCRVPVKRRPRRNGKGCLPSHRSIRMRTGKARPMVTRRVNDGAMQHQAQTGLPEGVPR